MSPVRHPNAPGCSSVREVLKHVGDKWSLLIIYALGEGPRRFRELQRGIEGISQRMLTLTLRGLERNGLVSRTVHPTVPPQVSYALTSLGRSLQGPVGALTEWASKHGHELQQQQIQFDRRKEAAAVSRGSRRRMLSSA